MRQIGTTGNSVGFLHLALLAATGRGYGDYHHIDLPFCVDTQKGMLVVLPHSDFADHRVLRGNPRDWYDVYRDTFDYLQANEPLSYLDITLHCHFGGRPLMAAQFDRILRYIHGFPDAWLVRHGELAQWIKSNTTSGNGPTGIGFLDGRGCSAPRPDRPHRQSQPACGLARRAAAPDSTIQHLAAAGAGF